PERLETAVVERRLHADAPLQLQRAGETGPPEVQLHQQPSSVGGDARSPHDRRGRRSAAVTGRGEQQHRGRLRIAVPAQAELPSVRTRRSPVRVWLRRPGFGPFSFALRMWMLSRLTQAWSPARCAGRSPRSSSTNTDGPAPFESARGNAEPLSG